MTNEEAIGQLKKHTPCDNTGFSDENDIEAKEMAIEALKKQIPKEMVLVGDDRKKIVRCPNCNINLAVAYYENGEITGTSCFGDIPPVAKCCKFCGQALEEVE